MNRSFVSALLSLACLSTLPALAQSAGSTQPDVTLSVGANPTASGVSLAGTVQPPMPSSPTALPHPGGTLTFFDGSTALNAGGTALAAQAAYSSATFAQTFGTPDPTLSAALSGFVSGGFVFGDFNGDGRPDLVIYSVTQAGTPSSALLLQVFVSNGDVTASPNGPLSYVTLPAQTIPMPSLPVYPGYAGDAAVIDIDGDGHLDLLLGNTVAYGKGDGTFSNPTVLPVLATGFSQAYAVDINGDGKLDIVAVNTPPKPTSISVTTVQYMFTVFRNDGGGTFTSLGTFPLAASFQTGNLCCAFYNIIGLSFTDLNGDGKLDVLSQSNVVLDTQSSAPLRLNVMLNKGDGTFGAPKPVDNSALIDIGSDGVAFGDLNGDGKQDLMLAVSNQTGMIILGTALGNGDGTFGAFVQLKVINFLTFGISNPQIQVMDVNADGKLDAIFGAGEVALGNGDGTFTLSTPLFAQTANLQFPLNYPLLQADLFPHSWPSLVYLNFTSGSNAVFTPLDSSSASTSVALSAGAHTLTAHYSGDSTYAAAISPAVDITVAPAATSTTLTSSANPSYAGQSVTFTATIAGLAPGAGGTVTFSNGSTTLGTATVSNGSASYATTLSSAGNQTITAAYGGDANDAASSGTVNQAVEAPVTIGGSGESTTLTVASGQSVTTKVSVAGAAGFSGTLNFSCTGLPANASCSFSPASMAVSGTTAASTMLTVSTAATMTASARDDGPSRAMTVLACGLPLLGLLTLLPVGRGRRLLVCIGFMLVVAAGGLTGCGGGSSAQSDGTKTTPGSYTFNVVAASGSTTTTASYTLTVQ